MKWTPALFRFALNLYGPYLGAGVKVTHISQDWREIHVCLRLRWYNQNIKKVHFGGSLYAMVDPHLMLMLMQILGKGYRVWDSSATIDFLKPGQGTVTCILTVSDDDLTQILKATQDGAKYFHTFSVNVLDQDSDIVAKVKKVLYIKKKQSRHPNGPDRKG